MGYGILIHQRSISRKNWRGRGDAGSGTGRGGKGAALETVWAPGASGAVRKRQAPVMLPQGGRLPQAALLSLCQPLGHPLLQLHSQLGLQLDPLALTPRLGVQEGELTAPLTGAEDGGREADKPQPPPPRLRHER